MGENPMYVFVALALSGEAILFGAPILFLYAAIAVTICHLWTLLYEERNLKRRFGEPYARYCQRVSRWIPRLPHRSGVINRASS
jgi:protein-S-isoprenylcysteine O-methyltransferase Ste14